MGLYGRAASSFAIVIAFFVALMWPPDLHAGNVYTGTCEGFKNYRDTVGVEDLYGNKHPGKGGWTLTYFEVETFVVPERSGKSYVPPALGCVRASVRAKFSAVSVYSVLEWIPSPAACKRCECEEAAKKWLNDITTHEKGHGIIAKEMADKRTKGWDVKHYEYCSPPGSKGGRAILSFMIKNAAERVKQALQEEYRLSPEIAEAFLQCSQCNCAVGEAPKLCAGAGQVCVVGSCEQQSCCKVYKLATTNSPGSEYKTWTSSGPACGSLGAKPGYASAIVANCCCTKGCDC